MADDQAGAAGDGQMIGARALIASLVGAGVDACFMNPGTSEMHFVHSLDAVPRMRGILCLFEGVATGAADGYARIAGRPAAVLLHLGPGLGNGLANLHNARRAHSPRSEEHTSELQSRVGSRMPSSARKKKMVGTVLEDQATIGQGALQVLQEFVL